jgi:hypothetical protein
MPSQRAARTRRKGDGLLLLPFRRNNQPCIQIFNGAEREHRLLKIVISKVTIQNSYSFLYSRVNENQTELLKGPSNMSNSNHMKLLLGSLIV